MNNKTYCRHPFRDVCIITDLDDTLLCGSHKLSTKNREAIHKFMELGGSFTIATGRAYSSVKNLNIPTNLPGIFFNGSAIYDMQTEHLYWSKPLDASGKLLIQLLIEQFPEIGIEIFTFHDIYLITQNHETEKHIELEKINPTILSPNQLDDIGGEWQKLLIAWDPEHINKVTEYLHIICKKYNFPYAYHTSLPFLLEIIHNESGKGKALMEFSKLFSIPIEKIIAIGDNQNDIDFLKRAGFSIAVSNALDSVKEVADYVTVDNDHYVMKDVLDFIGKRCGE